MQLIFCPKKEMIIYDYDGITPYRIYKANVSVLIWDGRADADKIYKRFRRMVFTRDNNRCRCGNDNVKELRVHHIKRVSKYPHLYYDIDNAITLCEKCHKKTKSFGRK